MIKNYINHLCIVTLASTLYACGGSSNSNSTPSAPTPQAANSSSSSSGGPIIVNFTEAGIGQSFRYSFSANDQAGRGFSNALNGVDLRQFTTIPTAEQKSGTVTLNGYLEMNNVAHLPVTQQVSQRFAGASTLTFNFAEPTNPITGSANNFGVYTRAVGRGSIASAATDCTFTTCFVYTKVRDLTGELTISGTETNSNITLTLMGTLRDDLTLTGESGVLTPISITHNFDNIALSGTLRTMNPTSNALLARTNNTVNVPRTTGSTSDVPADSVVIFGEWRR